MLPITNRLKDEKIIRNLFRYGKSIHGEIVFLRYQKNNYKNSFSKIAVIIGTKIAPLATDRNYLKRIIRATVKELLIEIPSGFNFVIGISDRNSHLYSQKKNSFKKKIATDIKTVFKKINQQTA